jgi:DNA helicase-2/ATP-dependent DNA helicase PcrA
LTLLLLRLLFVEESPGDVDGKLVQTERVPAESVMITTFTEKAATNLRDRIATYRSFLVVEHPELEDVDISQLLVGTLHELCNDILQEYGYPDYENVKLVDQYEQSMLIYEHHSLVQQSNPDQDRPFWNRFSYLFRDDQYQEGWRYLPNKWLRAEALQTLFRSIVEDRVSVRGMRQEGGEWGRLANAYEEYQNILEDHYRCDFAHLQKRFLDFLDHPVGESFLTGREEQNYDGIRWVLVDEYQDTNRIQERIYFRLAERDSHNLVVVGDDDQALYRFRGGSVECMVSFDDACATFFSDFDSDLSDYQLVKNFRSHEQIVEFCNDYIRSFDVMQQEGARIEKGELEAHSDIAGDHEAVGYIRADTLDDLGEEFAETVRDLVENGVVQDANQCCLLLKTTQEGPQQSGPYVEALRDQENDLEPYNPRNKAFLEHEEVQILLGALLTILDPDLEYCPDDSGGRSSIEDSVRGWVDAYEQVASGHQELEDYVEESRDRIGRLSTGDDLDYELLEIAYYLLSLPPFTEWKDEPYRRRRLGKVTELLEAFQSTPVQGYPNVSKGQLSVTDPGQIHPGWLRTFYYVPIGYLVRSGQDDVEIEDVICPSGMVPVMTIHQAKGLEFPFVFVGTLTENDSPGAEHQLEDDLAQFPINPDRIFEYGSAEERARRDLVRKYYVAYSRAKHALVLMMSDYQFGTDRAPMGPHPHWLRRQILQL